MGAGVVVEPLPLLPDTPPRRCRSCRRPVPKGPLTDGLGSGCAREHGVLPAPTPRITAAGQEGESLLDLLNGDAHRVGGNPGVEECPELRGKGVTVNDMIEWLNRVLDQRDAVANAAADYGPEWRYSGSAIYPSDESRHPGAIVTGSYGDLEDQYGEHIALNDPQQILDDVAADRAILGLHQESMLGGTGIGAGDCASCMNEAWPCPTLRHLAAKYATWPGYQEAWRP